MRNHIAYWQRKLTTNRSFAVRLLKFNFLFVSHFLFGEAKNIWKKKTFFWSNHNLLHLRSVCKGTLNDEEIVIKCMCATHMRPWTGLLDSHRLDSIWFHFLLTLVANVQIFSFVDAQACRFSNTVAIVRRFQLRRVRHVTEIFAIVQLRLPLKQKEI